MTKPFYYLFAVLAISLSSLACTSDDSDSLDDEILENGTVGDLTYKLIWSDEFDGTEINEDNWTHAVGGTGWGNSESQYYTARSENSWVEDGCLVIEALKETYINCSYTSARLISKDKFYFTYGKVECRLSIPSGQGTWPAYWMLGQDVTSWPLGGEIDIMEHVGSQPTMLSHATHTYEKNGMYGNNWSSKTYLDDAENTFHIYTMEWLEEYDSGDDCIIFYIDGVKTATVWQTHLSTEASVWPFDKNFYFLFNIAMGGSWGGTIDDSIFDNEIKMYVDYIRVYQLQ